MPPSTTGAIATPIFCLAIFPSHPKQFQMQYDQPKPCYDFLKLTAFLSYLTNYCIGKLFQKSFFFYQHEQILIIFVY